jgi:hypothetical protein
MHTDTQIHGRINGKLIFKVGLIICPNELVNEVKCVSAYAGFFRRCPKVTSSGGAP